MTSKRRRLWWVIGLGLCGTAAGPGPFPRASAPADEVVYREDFEGPDGLGAGWQAFGPTQAARLPVEGGDLIDGVAGHALLIKAESGGTVRTRPLPGPPPIARCERVVLRVDAGPVDPRSPVVLEVHFYEARRRAWFWRKVTVDRPGWQELDLPLAYFGGGAATYPSWQAVDRLGFLLRNGGTLRIDGIELRDGDPEAGAALDLDQLRDDAFGPEAETRVGRQGPFAVLTDAPGLDLDAVLEAIEAMGQRTQAEFPGLPGPTDPVPLVIFAEDADYRGFWPRFARRFNLEAAPPGSGGFTALGVATSACSPDDPGVVRPVFVHEASHALMSRQLGLASRGEWLLEGLATRYQLDFSGQDIRPIVRKALADASFRSPLADLLDGEPIPESRYWQAATWLEWLLADPMRRQAFDAALESMRERGSTDFRPLAEPSLGAALPELEGRWLKWLGERYGAGS